MARFSNFISITCSLAWVLTVAAFSQPAGAQALNQLNQKLAEEILLSVSDQPDNCEFPVWQQSEVFLGPSDAGLSKNLILTKEQLPGNTCAVLGAIAMLYSSRHDFAATIAELDGGDQLEKSRGLLRACSAIENSDVSSEGLRNISTIADVLGSGRSSGAQLEALHLNRNFSVGGASDRLAAVHSVLSASVEAGVLPILGLSAHATGFIDEGDKISYGWDPSLNRRHVVVVVRIEEHLRNRSFKLDFLEVDSGRIYSATIFEDDLGNSTPSYSISNSPQKASGSSSTARNDFLLFQTDGLNMGREDLESWQRHIILVEAAIADTSSVERFDSPESDRARISRASSMKKVSPEEEMAPFE